MHREAGLFLLGIVDVLAAAALAEIKHSKDEDAYATILREIHFFGLFKHRLEYGLGFQPAFPGPSAWGYPYPKKHPK
jgi:hypothetical protein